jgi:hypothetical protein
MKRTTSKRSQNIDSDRRKRTSSTSNRTQRGTSRGSERLREYRGQTRYDFRDDRDYDMYDRDLSRDNEEQSEYERRGGNGHHYNYHFENEYPRSQFAGRHRKHEWDEGFGDYDDYDQYDDEYGYDDRDRDYGMTDEMEDRSYNELYRGHNKRINTPRGFSDMRIEEVRDRGRNNAMRGSDRDSARGRRISKYPVDDRGETSRGDRRGGTSGRSNNRSGGAYHTWDEIDTEARPGRRRRLPRRAYSHLEQEPRVASRYGSSPRGSDNSERSSTREKRSKLGNSAPGSRMMNRRPKTRKKGAEYTSVTVEQPVLSRSKRRGTTAGKRKAKSKVIRNP